MLCSLISGSSGNSSLVTYKNTKILIDCGMSCKRLEGQLAKLGMSPADVSAIMVTHEHIDHICGVGVVSRKYNLPIFATEQTHNAMNIGTISNDNICIIEPDRLFTVGDIIINAFSIPHDAAAPVGYRFFCGEKKYCVATDIGLMTDVIFDSISGSESVIIEANHDIPTLKNGSYPERLKERILSNSGHMSNELCANTVLALTKRGTKRIMLAHLSEENNTPELAYDTVKSQLEGIDDIELVVADRYEVTLFDKHKHYLRG